MFADWRALYPFEPHWIEHVGGVRQHFIDEGSGDPVLFLHGNPTWSFFYRDLVKALRRQHRCVAIDHVGCGLSDKPQDYEYRLAKHIENAEAIVKRLDLKKITLVVHDWGGPIGFGLAARCPERFSRFVVFNTAAFSSKRMPWRIGLCRIPIFGTLAIRGFNAFARGATVMAVAGRPLAPEVRAGFVAPYYSWADRIATLRFVEDIPMDQSHPSWGELKRIEQALPRFKDRPMLICWGMKDWCFTDLSLARWEREFPDARVFKFQEAGHYLLEDSGSEIIPVVQEWLGEESVAAREI